MPDRALPTDPALWELTALAALPEDAAVSVRPVSALLNSSERHVWRMVDLGLMPAPLHIGRLRRWRIGTIREWIRGGCKPARSGR